MIQFWLKGDSVVRVISITILSLFCSVGAYANTGQDCYGNCPGDPARQSYASGGLQGQEVVVGFIKGMTSMYNPATATYEVAEVVTGQGKVKNPKDKTTIQQGGVYTGPSQEEIVGDGSPAK